MTGWLPALLAGLAVAAVLAVPRPGPVRLAGLVPVHRPRRQPPVLLLVAVPVAVTLGPVAGALALGGAVLGGRAATRRRLAADQARERAAALDALALLGAELRAGRPPAAALQAAADTAHAGCGTVLAMAAATARLGGDVPGVLAAGGSAVDDGLRSLAACWQVCSATGSGLAAAVERLEEGLRAAEEQRRQVAGELAGPRATAGLLAVLPLAGLGLAAALGAHPVRVLLHTPVGLVCLLGGLLLDGLGMLWARRLVSAAMSA